MANLKLKNVYKKFPGGVIAVNDLSLDVDDKEFLVIVGPSGCGKTTTLRMIAGLDEITEGEIYIEDKLVNDIAPKDRDIAMVFQDYSLYPHMTVFNNIAFGLKIRKVPRKQITEQVNGVATTLGIEHLLDRKPKILSGGQRQRVALARAIVRSPKVFLMDEPLSNLDAKLRGQMRIEISKFHLRLQATIIYVTHDQTEAMIMGTKIVVMKDGFIQQIDSPQSLYERPVNLFVAEFIGSPAMNLVDVIPERIGESIYLAMGNEKIKIPDGKARKLEDAGDYVGNVMVMGIRCEDVHDEELFLQSSPETKFNGEVEVVENLGSETLIYFVSQGNDMIAKVSPRTKIKPGDRVTFSIDSSRIHLFDKETELVVIN